VQELGHKDIPAIWYSTASDVQTMDIMLLLVQFLSWLILVFAVQSTKWLLQYLLYWLKVRNGCFGVKPCSYRNCTLLMMSPR